MLDIDMVAITSSKIEDYISNKKPSKKKRKEEESMAEGLLSRRNKMEAPSDDLDLTERVAEYVMQIREQKEAILNGRNK